MLKQSCVRIKRVIFNGLSPVRPAICIWVVLLLICGRLAIGEVRVEYDPAGGRLFDAVRDELIKRELFYT